MATEQGPAKHHQPLHNFSLSFLKWGQRIQINTHNRRSRNRNRNRNNNNNANGNDNGNSHIIDSSDSDSAKPLRSRTENTKTQINEQSGGVFIEKRNNKLSDVDVVTAIDGEVKPWNLRPRRFSITGDGTGNGAAVSSVKSRRLLRGVGVCDGGVAAADEKEEDRMKKRRLWISLSKEEIEEDVYAFTGSKPARRPKKRNRSVQKLLDNVFPGLYLVGISADSYRV